MALAFVLIEVSAGYVLSVFNELRKIHQVKACYAITGQYDIIAEIEAEDINHVGKISLNKIQQIPGVLRTITCNVINIKD